MVGFQTLKQTILRTYNVIFATVLSLGNLIRCKRSVSNPEEGSKDDNKSAINKPRREPF